MSSFFDNMYEIGSYDCSVGIAKGWTDEESGFDFRQRQDNSLLCISRPALMPAQPSLQWVPGVLSPEVKLTTHLHLVPRSRMMELYLHYPSVLMA
jgi:hypothetical protein